MKETTIYPRVEVDQLTMYNSHAAMLSFRSGVEFDHKSYWKSRWEQVRPCRMNPANGDVFVEVGPLEAF